MIYPLYLWPAFVPVSLGHNPTKVESDADLLATIETAVALSPIGEVMITLSPERPRQKAHGRDPDLRELIYNVDDIACELSKVKERLDALEAIHSNTLIGGQ